MQGSNSVTGGPIAPVVSINEDEALITRLQRRLRPARGPGEVKRELVKAAVAWARSPMLASKDLYQRHPVPLGGSRTRVVQYRDRIVHEKLLDLEEAAESQSIIFGLPIHLHVQQHWIAQEAKNLRDVKTEQLVLSDCKRFATRAICAHNILCGELVRCKVKYDVPTSGEKVVDRENRADRHRRREEAVIRELDGVAAAEHRLKKAKLQRGLREQRQARATPSVCCYLAALSACCTTFHLPPANLLSNSLCTRTWTNRRFCSTCLGV